MTATKPLAELSAPCLSPERWAHSDDYICIEGRAVRVTIDQSSDRGRDLQVNALCPECGDATDWTMESHALDLHEIVDRSCGKRWVLQHGIPATINPSPAFPPNRIIREGQDPVDKPAPGAPMSFTAAAGQSIHVERIARELFAAATAASLVPDLVWNSVDPRVRERLRRRATLVILELNSGLVGLATSTVKQRHGAQAEAVLDTYRDMLLKHALIVGAVSEAKS